MNRIKEVLDEKGIKQTWLAEQLGKNYNMVNAYVQNRQQPRIELLYEIAEILGVNVKELLIDNEIKKDKKMSNEQKITTDIKVPNKDLEILRSHFPYCFDKDGKFDFAKFQKELEAQNVELSFEKESYGLDWLGKSYARLLASDPATTLLKADETHNQKSENINSQNLLIKGDNLEALKHLANAYYEKVKMIYIDPPYNTGSDGFVYNDDRKYTVEQLQELLGIDKERAKRILDFTQSKSNSHSAWLTFMYPRLYIAKQLLREDGVIFVSIDDNEVAQLKILMDEIYGEENFIIQFTREAIKGGSQSKFVRETHDFILVYAKKISDLEFVGFEKDELELNLSDAKGKYAKGRELNKWGAGSRREDSPGMWFPIKGPEGEDVYPIRNDGSEGRWRLGKAKMKKLVEDGDIIFEKRDNGTYIVYEKLRANKSKYIQFISILKDKYINAKGTEELKNLFKQERAIFDFSKPPILIKDLLILSDTQDSDLILDFFAGSGTTGDAVMQLNAEDGGNRKFILVQLPEPIEPKKNKTAYDFVRNELKAEPTIFEITRERLIRAAKKIKTETIDKKIAEKEKELQNLQSELNLEGRDEKIATLNQEIAALKNQDLGFKIFETMPIWEDYDFEAAEFNPQLKLFDTSKLTEDDVKALLITWKTYDGMPLTEDLETITLDGYPTCYGNGKLYLMHKGFNTDTLKTLLEKIDSDRHFEPKSIIAFGYHFESARLRELSENVKNYANKKHIDIEFIIRY
ncbi:MAG: DNA methyltransferase [Bacteroidota bacterium]